ncbi:MAG TPA: radical SAM protein, partial [Elusimicrobiota bacterium]|nr:radical SAM protein [Elusimicrobiota bacterium]
MSDLPSAELESALTWAENADFTSYVFQYPPLAVWSGSPDRAAIRRSWAKAARGGEETGLYVHVPFCRTKCTFCRFFVLEDSGEAGRDAYIRALDREAGLWAPVVKGARFTTLYIGGGTPSLLSAAQLDALFASLRGRFRLSNLAQVSFEANPEFLDERKLGVLRRAGVDRLTLGVQSLDDEVTAAVERSQTNRSVGRVFALAREAGIRSINIDLMTGLPRQTLESFRETFEEVLSWRPDSIHVNPFLPTALTRFAERGGRLGPAALSRSSAMQRYAAERMKRAGFRDLPHDAMALDPRARNIQLEDGVILDRSFL